MITPEVRPPNRGSTPIEVPGNSRPGLRVLGAVLLLLVPFVLAACEDDEPFVGQKQFPKHAAQTKSPFLHQRGKDIVGPDGKPRVLRSVNLGGWLLWECYIFGGEIDLKRLDQGSESQMLERFESYYGTEAARRFQEAIYDHFYEDADFHAIRTAGFDSVRLPLNHSMLERKEGRERLRRVVSRLKKAGLGVILDLHAAPGGQSRTFPADPDAVLLWDDPGAQDRLVSLWEDLARDYAEEDAVWGYDLLNEPDPSDPAQLIALYRRLIHVIRKHDRDHLVFLEGAKLSRNFNVFTERLDENMAYSPHVYLWIGNPDQTWLERLKRLERLHDTPVWVGEFGEDLVFQLKPLRRGFEKLSGWAIWPWKRVEGGLAGGVYVFRAPRAWKRLIASLHPKNRRQAVMPVKEAFAALSAFLEASRRLRPFPGMADALGVKLGPTGETGR